MQKHILGQTGIATSRLGFGCSHLTDFGERRQAIRTLEQAFALGITHFDAARMYGWGRAEGILGEFLRGKRQQVTVATKFGTQPPSGVWATRGLFDLAKKILGPFPGLRQRARRSAAKMEQHGLLTPQRGAFTPQSAVQSLEISLRELGTDFIDVFFLHEPTLSDAAAEPLIEALRRQVSRGTIRSFGVAPRFQELQGDASRFSSAYEVLQFEDDALARNLPRLAHRESYALITHSVFRPFAALREAIATQPGLTQRFSSQTELDLADARVLGSLLLQYALRSNAEGVVLFSSLALERIGSNVRDNESCPYTDLQLSGFVDFAETVLRAAPSRAAS